MSFIGRLVSKITGADAAAAGQQQAAQTQSAAAQAGIDEQRRQFDALREAMAPFVSAGVTGLKGQQDLAGLNGPQAQRAALDAIRGGSEFQALQQEGANTILQNASATGGLRGGNVQSALGQFSPALLSQLINQQYERLGGFTSLGANAAAGVGNAGVQTGSNVANLLGQQGAATAGGLLARGNLPGIGFGQGLQIAGAITGAMGGFGGGGSGVVSGGSGLRIPTGKF